MTISKDVPALYDVAIGGHGYMLDTKHPAFGGESAYLGRMGMETIPLIRQQADAASEPGESTINPEDLWPRVQSSWHKGAGQNYLDAPDSDRTRFRASLGLDPWTRGQLKLLPYPNAIYSGGTASAVPALPAGQYIYFTTSVSTTLNWIQTPGLASGNPLIQAGETSAPVLSLATDGHLVYAALGTNGIHYTVIGSTSSFHYNDLQATLVGYVKSRLMAAKGSSVYNITSAGVAPTALFTHPNSDFAWVGFTEGTNNIYMAGYSGSRSLIYRTAVKTDGTALDAPVVAGELPYGEIVYSIQGYLGYVAVGTDRGWRVATQDGQGNLTFGPDVKTNAPVRCFTPSERFLYFGWENYDATHTGIGRMDLSQFTSDGVPAYATDMMVDPAGGSGIVSSVFTDWQGKVCFLVVKGSVGGGFAGSALYTGSTGFTRSASLDSGYITFGIPDTKIALRLGMKHKALVTGTSIAASINPDDIALVSVGTSNTVGSVTPAAPFAVPELAARHYEVHLDFTTTSNQVTLESYDFRAWPASTRGHTILIPILLYEEMELANGAMEHVDILAEYKYIDALVGATSLSDFQDLSRTTKVIVEDLSLQKHHATGDRSWWNGTLLLKLKEP